MTLVAGDDADARRDGRVTGELILRSRDVNHGPSAIRAVRRQPWDLGTSGRGLILFRMVRPGRSRRGWNRIPLRPLTIRSIVCVDA